MILNDNKSKMVELSHQYKRQETYLEEVPEEMSLENLMLMLALICLTLCCLAFSVCCCIRSQVAEDEEYLIELARKKGKKLDIEELRKQSMIDYSREGTTIMAGDMIIA